MRCASARGSRRRSLGRRCLVTGANSGIGFETSLALADLGADVVLLCRRRERGEQALARIRSETGNRRVSLELLDVSDLASVRAVGARLADSPVDVLVHNAGVLPDERGETSDGLELALATHVVGPWLLTRLLRPRARIEGRARDLGLLRRHVHPAPLAPRPELGEARYDGVRAYAETKRAQVVLAELWAEELAGSSVVVNAMHPGWADTPAVQRSLPRFHRLARSILRTPGRGRRHRRVAGRLPRGARLDRAFFFDREPRRTHLLPFTRESRSDRRRSGSCRARRGRGSPATLAAPDGVSQPG